MMSSLLSCQISVGATIILPWNIVGGYSTGASVGDLYTSICNGSVGTGWELPAKYKDFSVKASIERSKTDSFDNVMLSVSVSEAVASFGRYLRFNLVEQKKPGPKENTICSKKKTKNPGKTKLHCAKLCSLSCDEC